MSARFPSRPAPTQDGPGAAPCVRRRRPQNSTVRLGRRAAVAPPVRTPSLPPWLPPSQSVVPSFSVLSLLPSLPRVPVRVPGTASDSSLPAARVSFPRGSGGGGRGVRGGRGGAGTISAATALVRLGCPSALSCGASEAPLPHPCFLHSEAGGALCRILPPLHLVPGLALHGARCSPRLLPRRP